MPKHLHHTSRLAKYIHPHEVLYCKINTCVLHAPGSRPTGVGQILTTLYPPRWVLLTPPPPLRAMVKNTARHARIAIRQPQQCRAHAAHTPNSSLAPQKTQTHKTNQQHEPLQHEPLQNEPLQNEPLTVTKRTVTKPSISPRRKSKWIDWPGHRVSPACRTYSLVNEPHTTRPRTPKERTQIERKGFS